MSAVILSALSLTDEATHVRAPVRLDQTDHGPPDRDVLSIDASPSRALAPYEPNSPTFTLGATTLRLVERSVEEMQAMRQHLDRISAQARDLIQLTDRERSEREVELRQAKAEVGEWRRRAMELEFRMREAQLRVREAEMGRREAEQVAGATFERARAAEAEASVLEGDLRKISDLLQVNLAP